MGEANEWRKKKLTYPIQRSHHLTKEKNKRKDITGITNYKHDLKYIVLEDELKHKFCHHLLILMSFQNCLTYLSLLF